MRKSKMHKIAMWCAVSLTLMALTVQPVSVAFAKGEGNGGGNSGNGGGNSGNSGGNSVGGNPNDGPGNDSAAEASSIIDE